jgi:hypothetical protein
MHAVRVLQDMGYSTVSYYKGGLEDWQNHGGRLVALPGHRKAPQRRGVVERAAGWLEDQSTARVLGAWLTMVLTCTTLGWLSALAPEHTLTVGGLPIALNASGLWAAMYWSVITATSVGYGDVTPNGALRAVAMAEAVGGLLLFGVIISKLVGRRQEALVGEIHRITYEDRLDRVQTNLHLVLSELQGAEALGATRLGPRLESTVRVFASELRTIHDLLYHPDETPDENVLQHVLVALASCIHELREVLPSLPEASRPDGLRVCLVTIAQLANEVCGECVPREYTPSLKRWMDRIQEDAHALEGPLH